MVLVCQSLKPPATVYHDGCAAAYLQAMTTLWSCAGRAVFDEANLVFRTLAMEILDILIQGLRVDAKHFQAHKSESQGVLRANYYHQSRAPDQVLGLIPHVDGNLFTILHQHDVSGLEVLKDGRWNPIPPVNDAFCINVADIMQVGCLTVFGNGAFKPISFGLFQTCV